MRLTLGGGQRQQPSAQDLCGQRLNQVFTATLQQQARELFADLFQPGIVHRLAGFACDLQLTQRGQGALSPAVQKVHQLIEQQRLFVQRCAAQHKGLVGTAALQRLPMLGLQGQPLGLVDDHQLGRPQRDLGRVAGQGLGRKDAQLGRLRPLRLPLVRAAGQHLGLLARHLLPGAVPGHALRRRAQHGHALQAEMLAPELGRGDGLHALAQAMLVGQQRTAGHHRPQRAFGLVQRQRHAEQGLQRGTGRTVGIG